MKAKIHSMRWGSENSISIFQGDKDFVILKALRMSRLSGRYSI